jgi:hypothetical protein
MPSVFAGNQVHNGSFRADLLSLRFGNQDARGLLVQNVNFTFGQAVSMLYEIGSAYVYYVGGRAQGTAGLGHIVGPSKFGQRLVELFRDLCNPHDIGFNAGNGCGTTANGQPFRGGTKYLLQDAVLVSLGVTVTAEQVVINKMLSFMFIDLEYEGGTGPPSSNTFTTATGDTVTTAGPNIEGGVVVPPGKDENTFVDTTFTEEPPLGAAPDPDTAFDTTDLGDIPTLDDLNAGNRLSLDDQFTLEGVLSGVPRTDGR